MSMKSDSSGSSDLERVIGRAAVEAARMSSQASQAAKKILGDVSSEIGEAKSSDLAPIDLIETEDELIALVALPGASKEKIDLRVTEDSLYVDAKANPREGKYLRQGDGHNGPQARDQAAHRGQAGTGKSQLQRRHIRGAPSQARGHKRAEGAGGLDAKALYAHQSFFARAKVAIF